MQGSFAKNSHGQIKLLRRFSALSIGVVLLGLASIGTRSFVHLPSAAAASNINGQTNPVLQNHAGSMYIGGSAGGLFYRDGHYMVFTVAHIAGTPNQSIYDYQPDNGPVGTIGYTAPGAGATQDRALIDTGTTPVPPRLRIGAASSSTITNEAGVNITMSQTPTISSVASGSNIATGAVICESGWSKGTQSAGGYRCGTLTGSFQGSSSACDSTATSCLVTAPSGHGIIDTGDSGGTVWQPLPDGTIRIVGVVDFGRTCFSCDPSYNSFSVGGFLPVWDYPSYNWAPSQTKAGLNSGPGGNVVSTPQPPTGITVMPQSGNAVTVTWNQSSEVPGDPIAGYYVYRNGQQIGAVGRVGSFVDNNVPIGFTNTYSVAVYDQWGITRQGGTAQTTSSTVISSPAPSAGTPSASPSPSGGTVAPPQAPTGIDAVAQSASTVAVTWYQSRESSQNPAAGYYIYRNGVQVGMVGRTGAFVDKSVQPGTTYVYSVAVYDRGGNVVRETETRQVTTNGWPAAWPTALHAPYKMTFEGYVDDITTYPDHGMQLTDGKLGSRNFADSQWFGINSAGKATVTWTLDLGSQQQLWYVNSRWLYTPSADIYLPSSVAYSVSSDGLNFTPLATTTHNATVIAGVDDQVFDYAKYVSATARYVRVTASFSNGYWMFTDQLTVN